jgi:hypothetical protein
MAQDLPSEKDLQQQRQQDEGREHQVAQQECAPLKIVQAGDITLQREDEPLVERPGLPLQRPLRLA